MSDWIGIALVLLGLIIVASVGSWASRKSESNIVYWITSAGILAGLIFMAAGFLGILANASL